MPVIDYTPPKSALGFLTSDKFIALIVGPVGSTKTTAAIMKIVYHAKRMCPCQDGVRRSRAIWIRNTREQLRDTSIPDFLKWFPDGMAGTYEKTNYKFTLRFDDVECEVLFRGLDDAQDVRRLLSLQASFAILDEFREINPEIFDTLQGRLGRYPDKLLVPPRPEWGLDEKGNPIGGCVMEDGQSNAHVWGATNPPDMDTFWEKYLTEPPANASVFFQPSGLSPEADWVEFLPSGYYENLAEGKSEDWVDVYINAKFGKSLSGQPVFRAFSRDTHVAKDSMNRSGIFVSSQPVIIGFDCGLNPSAVMCMVGYDGRLLVYDALTSEGMGALRFVREKLKPLLANKYPGAKVVIAIDPAANQRAQTDERSVAELLRTEGFLVKPARTNAIIPRLASVDAYLTRMVEGKPGIMFNTAENSEMQTLIMAMAGKYRYKINTKGEMDDKPDKNHPHSDLADALQYAAMHADNGATFGMTLHTERREVKTSPVRWAV